MKFYNFKNQNSNIKKINDYFIIFDNIVILSYIKIFNYKEDINKGIRKIIIKLEQNIIFEGYVNKVNANLNGTTCILFTCDLNITKDIQENELPNYSENIEMLKNLQNRKEIKTKKGKILKLV
jgi:predicted oxidoreductase (fatty acid repression mutant protein)